MSVLRLAGLAAGLVLISTPAMSQDGGKAEVLKACGTYFDNFTTEQDVVMAQQEKVAELEARESAQAGKVAKLQNDVNTLDVDGEVNPSVDALKQAVEEQNAYSREYMQEVDTLDAAMERFTFASNDFMEHCADMNVTYQEAETYCDSDAASSGYCKTLGH